MCEHSQDCREQMGALVAAHIEDDEMRQLGHRIVYDTKTGWSINIYGMHCDPLKLDAHGYQVRL